MAPVASPIYYRNPPIADDLGTARGLRGLPGHGTIPLPQGRAAHGFMGRVTDSEDEAALEIHEITFDARDPHALAAFWAALLEREIRPGDMPQDDSVLIVPTPGQPGLLFLRVPEGKTAKNRIHLDLWPTSSAKRDEQIERATGLGAVMLDDRRRGDGTGWVVFADPDGNEFCLGRSAAERAAGRGWRPGSPGNDL
jgi:catechol 2,3-dioxygenase-like lactoylglutathione lyase family enzyme